jgi:hypothetical protein
MPVVKGPNALMKLLKKAAGDVTYLFSPANTIG